MSVIDAIAPSCMQRPWQVCCYFRPLLRLRRLAAPVSDSTKGERQPLSVEPHVLEAPAIENAVDDKVETLHARPPAGRDTGIEDDRTRGVARQPALDLPY